MLQTVYFSRAYNYRDAWVVFNVGNGGVFQRLESTCALQQGEWALYVMRLNITTGRLEFYRNWYLYQYLDFNPYVSGLRLDRQGAAFRRSTSDGKHRLACLPRAAVGDRARAWASDCWPSSYYHRSRST